MLDIKVKGIKELQKALKVENKRQQKALETAIKVEGFRQLRELRDEIRKGKPGGHPYAHQLSEIASRTKSGKKKKNQIPLYRLARLVRYRVEFRGGNMQLSFGFVASKNSRLSTSWKQLLIEHQEGAEVLYTGSRTELGRRFARIGGRLKKAGDPDAKYFFLRRSTGRRIGIPNRPIIDPFWKKRASEAQRNIAKNFKRKMRGERI
jgi:hypothetical protein